MTWYVISASTTSANILTDGVALLTGPVQRFGRRELHVHRRRRAVRIRAVLLPSRPDGKQGVGGDGGRALDALGSR